jgi:hypothetical protein
MRLDPVGPIIRTTMQTATATALPHDRICNWHEEVQRILPNLPSLAPGAQCAVRAVIASIVDEDEKLGLAVARPWSNLALTKASQA